MNNDKPFHDYVVYDLLATISGISSRTMFGGYGIYKNKKIFALIADGELYFRGNSKTAEFFKSNGSHPFMYNKKDGKISTMNYWLVPENIYEEHDSLAQWMDVALK